MDDNNNKIVESPLPPAVVRGLGERSYDKRKMAAFEIEALIKSLQDGKDKTRINNILHVLGDEFTTSSNNNHRKGGLIALAACAIGLMNDIHEYLDILLPPVLHCFDDPESRVRYYACESLYNIAKVARQSILTHFYTIFDGLCKLFADVDVDVKNGVNLLDRLIKDIVTESENFNVEKFIPLLRKYIKRTNPYIRQFLVGWITVLDSVPGINMLDWLPDFLDGLLQMLSDGNREIRQAADSALSEFLKEIKKQSSIVSFKPMIKSLISECNSKERLTRLTALRWIHEFINIGWDKLSDSYSDLLQAIMHCISDPESEIRQVAEQTNNDLLLLVKESKMDFNNGPLLQTLTLELFNFHVPTRLAALRWINMLLEKSPEDMNNAVDEILPALLKTLSDKADEVVLMNLQVLARIALNAKQFDRVLIAIVQLFQTDRILLETRGSLIIRQLCVLLNGKNIYMNLAKNLQKKTDLEFVGIMVQTLNLILLTATELAELRKILKNCLDSDANQANREVFRVIFDCWCHNPVATFSLCLLAQAYDVAAALVGMFAEVEITVGFLMQVDKLVQLLESPIFILLRLQLLEVEASYHSDLLKALYGLLMLLPQSNAFRTLTDRLRTVASHQQNLGGSVESGKKKKSSNKDNNAAVIKELLDSFSRIQDQHYKARQEFLNRKSLISSPSTPTKDVET